jgi:hypothetical protein
LPEQGRAYGLAVERHEKHLAAVRRSECQQEKHSGRKAALRDQRSGFPSDRMHSKPHTADLTQFGKDGFNAGSFQSC